MPAPGTAVVDEGSEDDEVDGSDDEDVGCAAAGSAGANASEVAASTDRTRDTRVMAIKDSTIGGAAPGQPRPTGPRH
jgi:hypothetical protein